MGKFCMRDFISPGAGAVSIEDPKVYFNLLVDIFHFAIGLGIICGGKREVIVQEFSKLFSKYGSKLWTTIGDDLVVNPK